MVRHRRGFFFQPRIVEQETIRVGNGCAGRGDVTIVAGTAAITRDDIAVVEHRLPRAENEIYVSGDIAFYKIVCSRVDVQRVLVTEQPDILENRFIVPLFGFQRDGLGIHNPGWVIVGFGSIGRIIPSIFNS